MKQNIFLILILFGFAGCFSTCKRIQLDSENTYIGKWNIAAIYINDGSTNMKSLAETIQPCLKGSTLEFTEDLKFDLKTDCEWMRAAGNYTFDDVAITATDTLDVSQITQVFTFVDGFLSKVVEAPNYTFDLYFKKVIE